MLKPPSIVPPAKKTILIIEDEPQIVMGLRDALEFEGFRVVATGKGKDGLGLARSDPPDAVILDLMLPDMNGYAVCEEIRRRHAFVPIIMLTARSQETDKIRGLDAGADDYVTKPFSVNELIARIRAIFRRAARGGGVPDVLDVGQGQVNFSAHTLSIKGKGDKQPLSFYEVELLRLLAERAGQPVSREEILSKIWGLEAGPSNRTVDNFIVKLRKKIEKVPDRPEHILTVYGFGYKLAVATDASEE
jgi:DNA-binding response OmpR family regulator